jgi:hypothetical protein
MNNLLLSYSSQGATRCGHWWAALPSLKDKEKLAA